MRDQIAGLKLAGISAGAIHSNSTDRESAELRAALCDGSLRLLYMAPERLLQPRQVEFLMKLDVGAIAVDEAHCISQWGHDFRPEYRRLADLRVSFPGVPIGAYTATATPRVRRDIVEQLGLRNAVELVGTFDRPNLTYRVLPRVDVVGQIEECLRRNQGPDGHVRAAIVYCISRKETERIAAALKTRGFDAAAYHAGMDARARDRVSARFRGERLDVVAATVAFGMGIDRSDVRCVIHAAMPKSIEHYQQETGRAGRDGLPAECLLLYSNADVVRWKQLMSRPGNEDGEPLEPGVIEAQTALLNHMHNLASGSRCRHKALSGYFGQEYLPPNCNACDVCLGELAEVTDGQTIARKILSCVARCEQRFGAKHIADVLAGSKAESIRNRGHEKLSTFGLLASIDREKVMSYMNQLIDAGDLSRTEGEYPVLQLTSASHEVLTNRRQVRLVEPKSLTRAKGRRPDVSGDDAPMSDVESRLFESLRVLRRSIADERGVPPYVVFPDTVLDELSRVRPGSMQTLLTVRGIGSRKSEEFGSKVLAHIRDFCDREGLALDARTGSRPRELPEASRPTTGASAAAPHFRRGTSVEDVCKIMERKSSTVWGYLEEYIRHERPASVEPWIDRATYDRVIEAQARVGGRLLRPIFEALRGGPEGDEPLKEVPYERIRIVLAHHQSTAP
jgi:ATP-dependent DNA helicase RecQ